MSPLSAGHALHALKVLLVEDSDDVRDAFVGLLRSEGADVVAVDNGRDAMAAALGGTFDVLLTDYGLPDIPGDVLITHVVATMQPRPHVVVVTGYGEPYIARARQAGADLVLTKPVEWSVLLGYLRPYVHPVAA
jgi:CheY-like chemotaxis protein